ncbi:glycosyltransferase [Crateriforma conspicua]|uniref:glycosyltransferase n=1 Tax=Crateriforma conspicua TaxID=2527996 RepID=UPI0011A6D2F5|nr:glycosyltransferase [Crateriforma conspicua]
MNRPIRILLMGRHFWPHGSHDSAMALLRLASGLARQGIHVEVVTPKHSTSWTPRCRWDRFSVHRPVTLPRRDWGYARYTRQLSSWITQHGSHFDAIVVDSMREEASAGVDAASALQIPCIVTDAGSDWNADHQWATRSRWNQKVYRSAMQADRILAPTADSHRRLIVDGCPADAIVRRAAGFTSLCPANAVRRREARTSLGLANLDMAADPDVPVALCIGSMTHHSGMLLAVENAFWMIGRYPRMRLWMIGDGPARDLMHQDLKANGVRHAVAMPGSFACLDDVFAAADLYLQLDSQGGDYFLPMAVSHAMPMVVCDSTDNRQRLGVAPEIHAVTASGIPDDTDQESIAWFASTESQKPFRQAFKQQMNRIVASLSPDKESAVSDRRNDAGGHVSDGRDWYRQIIRRHPYQAVVDQVADLAGQLCADRTGRSSASAPTPQQRSTGADVESRRDGPNGNSGGTVTSGSGDVTR